MFPSEAIRNCSSLDLKTVLVASSLIVAVATATATSLLFIRYDLWASWSRTRGRKNSAIAADDDDACWRDHNNNNIKVDDSLAMDNEPTARSHMMTNNSEEGEEDEREMTRFFSGLKQQTHLLSLNYNSPDFLRKMPKFRSNVMPVQIKHERQRKIDEFMKFLFLKLESYPRILERSFTVLNARGTVEVNRQFRIMQWNGLAKQLDKQQMLRTKCSTEAAFDWDNFRMWRLLEELVRFNCDIVCLQEADFHEDIKTYLGYLGYSNVFCPKYQVSCKYRKDPAPDGCSIFYDQNTFQLTQLRCQNILIDGNHHPQVFIIAQLKHLFTRKRLLVVCVHLKASESFAHVRTKQTEFVLGVIREHLGENAHEMTSSGELSIVICGDFNGDRIEPFYELIVKGTHTSAKLVDSYNRKINKHARFVDYVFHSSPSLKLINMLSYDSRRVKHYNLPNLSYPSDHLSLVCDFQFA